jgi:hypothetical protein
MIALSPCVGAVASLSSTGGCPATPRCPALTRALALARRSMGKGALGLALPPNQTPQHRNKGTERGQTKHLNEEAGLVIRGETIDLIG